MGIADHVSTSEQDVYTESNDSYDTEGSGNRTEGCNDNEVTADWQPLRIEGIEYTDNGTNTYTHIFGRDSSNESIHLCVDGHAPHFYVNVNEVDESFSNHYAVQNVEMHTGLTTVGGDPLARIDTYIPKQVREVKKIFDDHYEADVFYTDRVLIDNDIYDSLKFDLNEAEQPTHDTDVDYYVSWDNIESANHVDGDTRLLTIDIEVGSEDGFPEPEDAEWPVTTIVAHDSYSDEYIGWIYSPDGHRCPNATDLMQGADLDDARRFSDETEMLDDFNYHVASLNADIVSGWFSNRFDYPYLINRCKRLSVWSYKQWSQMENVYVNRRGEPRLDGATAFDMKDGYMKTQYHKPKSESLEHIASKELGHGKEHFGGDDEMLDEDNEFTWMWKNKPVDFLKYNQRDVEAVVQIEDVKDIVDLHRNLRRVTGTQWGSLGNNFNILDALVLRKASEAGYVLPTATKPEQDWYYGAFVFDPVAGVHRHVVYPDLSSLYPHMILMCNMSPETLVGTQEMLDESEWTEDDCVWSYVDTRTANVKQDSSPEYERCYFLKPSIKKGFVAYNVVKPLLEMKEQYRGTDMYMAVKAVVNSVYGVLGDSNTYGTGFRLFDWMLAESITLGGRKVIQYSAEKFIEEANEHDALGDNNVVVGGDTDSVMTSIDADDSETAVEAAVEIAASVNDSYEQFCAETFGIEPENNQMEIEVESYSPRLFYPAKDPSADPQSKRLGVKKRYASIVTWEDGEWLDEFEQNIKGFEAVRSDVANVTTDVQSEILDIICDPRIPLGEAEERIYELIDETVKAIENGETQMSEIGIPTGVGQAIHKYGSADRRPQPQYRGAKYANEFIYGDNRIGESDKPLYFYVDRVGGDYPVRYHADTAEDGTKVDCVTVVDADDLPDAIHVDTETMIEKTLKKPLTPILGTLGWSFDEAVSDTDQLSLNDCF